MTSLRNRVPQKIKSCFKFFLLRQAFCAIYLHLGVSGFYNSTNMIRLCQVLAFYLNIIPAFRYQYICHHPYQCHCRIMGWCSSVLLGCKNSAITQSKVHIPCCILPHPRGCELTSHLRVMLKSGLYGLQSKKLWLTRQLLN